MKKTLYNGFLQQYAVKRNLAFNKSRLSSFGKLKGTVAGANVEITWTDRLPGYAGKQGRKSKKEYFTRVAVYFFGGLAKKKLESSSFLHVTNDPESSSYVIEYNPRYFHKENEQLETLLNEFEWSDHIIDISLFPATEKTRSQVIIHHEGLVQRSELLDKLLKIALYITSVMTGEHFSEYSFELIEPVFKPVKKRRSAAAFIIILVCLIALGAFVFYNKEKIKESGFYENLRQINLPFAGFQSRPEQARQDLQELVNLLNEYFLNNQNVYPDSLATMIPEYIEEIPKDPWGAVYNYRKFNETEYVLYTFGKDGRRGGEDAARDIIVDSGIIMEETNQ